MMDLLKSPSSAIHTTLLWSQKAAGICSPLFFYNTELLVS